MKKYFFPVIGVVVLILIIAFFVFKAKDDQGLIENKTDEPTAQINQTELSATTSEDQSQNTNQTSTNNQPKIGEEVKNNMDQNKLKIEVLKAGTGDRITKPGDSISVHYTGTLLDGTKFDSSVDRGQPFEFVLGAGLVIRGWDEGLLGMKVGEKRKLTIPAEMAYGNQAVGPIPANSVLVFETELIGIK